MAKEKGCLKSFFGKLVPSQSKEDAWNGLLRIALLLLMLMMEAENEPSAILTFFWWSQHPISPKMLAICGKVSKDESIAMQPYPDVAQGLSVLAFPFSTAGCLHRTAATWAASHLFWDHVLLQSSVQGPLFAGTSHLWPAAMGPAQPALPGFCPATQPCRWVADEFSTPVNPWGAEAVT
jgi:hypothetical protein